MLELRVPAEHTGATFFYVVVEKRSKFAMGGTMRGYSEANVNERAQRDQVACASVAR